ncbi:hypothetical protein ACFVWN_06525 [Nocardiopsis flavescens]|uniref:hypothetical protein n=1 Tax=Nocardiopsis flavescens TaxID=758803 RepID=UPI00364D15AB
MSTAHSQAPDHPVIDDTLRCLHDEILALADSRGVDVFVFANEGRLLDASPAYSGQPVEQIAAVCATVVTGSHRCARLGRPDETDAASRIVLRYRTASVVLLPITGEIWAGCVSDTAHVTRAAHGLALFTEKAAPLVPETVGWTLPAMRVPVPGGEGR